MNKELDELLAEAKDEFYNYLHESENAEYRKGYAAGRLHSLLEIQFLLKKEER